MTPPLREEKTQFSYRIPYRRLCYDAQNHWDSRRADARTKGVRNDGLVDESDDQNKGIPNKSTRSSRRKYASRAGVDLLIYTTVFQDHYLPVTRRSA